MHRVRPGDPVAVLHPESGQHVVPKANELYADDDVLVRAYPWLFVSTDPTPTVEAATAAPGEKRTLTREK